MRYPLPLTVQPPESDLKKTDACRVRPSVWPSEEEQGNEALTQRWMLPYADILTLLLGVLIVMGSSGMSSPYAALVKQKKSIPQVASSNPSVASGDIPAQKLTLSDSQLFEPGQAQLTPQAQAFLHQFSDKLKACSSPISIQGHTDDTPLPENSIYPSNWELSVARSSRIARFLTEVGQIDPARISATGFGSYRPLASNSTVEGKRKNRRVDIVIVGEDSSQCI